MDIFVLPSYREGLPVTALEASAMQIPVITTNISGCNEVIVNNYSGLLINPGDTNDLKKAIETLINSRKLREQFGKNGRARMMKYFHPEHIWQKTLIDYKKLLR